MTAVGTTGRRSLTRDEVLDHAAEIFAKNGYRGTNLKLVAERLDVTRQALYHHFDSKSAILAALFDRLMTKLEKAVYEAAREASAAEAFQRMVRAHMSVIVAN